MDKKRWMVAAIILITLGIGICIVIRRNIKPEIQTITFKNCTVNYHYSTEWPNMEGEFDHAAKGRLAICLCQSYSYNSDTAVARKIMEIYNNDGRHILFNTAHSKNYNKLDSVIKYRKMVFDTVAQLD